MSEGPSGTTPIGQGLFILPKAPDCGPSLIGSQCSPCGYIAFPRRPVCPACLSRHVAEARIGQRARLESFAVARQAPPGFSAPYIQALVRLEEGPVVFTMVTGCEPLDDGLTIGQPMELVIEPIRQDDHGNRVLAWKYRPAGPIPPPEGGGTGTA